MNKHISFVAFVSICFDVSFSLSLICSPGRCGIFFGNTLIVEDEYLRAMLGKQ